MKLIAAGLMAGGFFLSAGSLVEDLLTLII